MTAWHVYLLLNSTHTRTYVGATIDPIRRLRQHNQEIVGGARATSSDQWTHACVIYGFPDERSALQFEWMWKHLTRKEGGRGEPLARRYTALEKLLESGRSSSTSIPFAQWGESHKLSIDLIYPIIEIEIMPDIFKKYIKVFDSIPSIKRDTSGEASSACTQCVHIEQSVQTEVQE